MISKVLGLGFFKQRSEYGVIFIRLVVGSFIIYGVQDNILSHERMEEFAEFLRVRNVPFPLFSAFLSVYTQFICGTLILIGAATRIAAVPFIINFIAALIIAHIGDTFRGMFPALMMLAAGLFFLFHGAGKFSVDEILEKRRSESAQGAAV